MRRTTLAAAALIPACALALSACGSSSGSGTTAVVNASSSAAAQNNAHLTQAQLVARFKSALADATALHMQGSMTQSGDKMSIDIQLNKSGSSKGTIVSNGITMPMIEIGTTLYTQITPTYLSMVKSAAGSSGNTAAANDISKYMPVGKWMKIDNSSTEGADSSGTNAMMNFASMAAQLSDGTSDKFTYLDTATVDGQQVAQYKDVSTDGSGPSDATMDIPLTGTALPIREDAGAQGSMTFTWNQPVTVTAPPAADVVADPSA